MYAVLIEIDDTDKDFHTKYTRSSPEINSKGEVYDSVEKAMEVAKWYLRHIAFGSSAICKGEGFKMADDGLSFETNNGSLTGRASVVKLVKI